MITVYPDRDNNLSQQGYELVNGFYVQAGEKSPQSAFARAAMYVSKDDDAFAQRIYDYVSQQWFMFSSPILSNATYKGEKRRGLPISCYLGYVPNTIPGLIGHDSELKNLSVLGGGVGGHWDDVQDVSEIAPGPIPFIKCADSAVGGAYKQGKTRKGAYAAYLSVRHPAILEFLDIRVPTGGDVNRKCFNIHNAVNIPNDFMEAVYADQEWELICPRTKEVRETIQTRKLWEKILETRDRTGEPYINFIDTANASLHPVLKELGLVIHGSNLCNEIHLPTSADRTAVCCLSSVNLEKYDEWKDHPTFIADLIRMLDNVLDIFIEEAPDSLSKARYSAMRSRDIGLGAMGFHGLLQQRGIAFESEEARELNVEIFSSMYFSGKEASLALGKERGAAPDLLGSYDGSRNCHVFAIAPNANSSIIAGCSASIEAEQSNAYMHNTRAGAHMIYNKYLKRDLQVLGLDAPEMWKRIVEADGSIQEIDEIPDHLKDIYKTAFEIDQHWVVRHAADRQPFICQGQSVNTYFPSGSSRCYVNSVHLMAWKEELKGLYYYRTQSAGKADKVGTKIDRVQLQSEECTACHA